MSCSPILIVDDDPDVRRLLTANLDHQGLEAQCVAGGKEALSVFHADKHSLVLCDVKLQDISGMEVLRHVKQKSPRTPVIMITGFGSVTNAVAAMQVGANDYLLKPFSINALQAALKKSGIGCDPGRTDDRRSSGDVNRGDRPIVTNDPKMLQVLKLARNVAASQATIIIEGESGTGKELLARYVHQHGQTPGSPYVAVNCAAMPDTLAESELFGHEKGAFTGAVNRKAGKFELARNGTIVLDEISEMSLALQAKLLRVLQERQIDRVGGDRPVRMQARVIAISNVALKQAVNDKKFRKDLYYRINVVPLQIPAIRERRGDIPLLADHFLHKYSRLNRKDGLRLSKSALALLTGHCWEGNIRELENAIERAVLLCSGQTVRPEDLVLDEPDGMQTVGRENGLCAGLTVREMEKRLIFKTLREVDDNRTHAAVLLGISIRTLRNKLREYRVDGPA